MSNQNNDVLRRKREYSSARNTRKIVASAAEQSSSSARIENNDSPAALAQRLASESSWADRFVPNLTSQTDEEGDTSQDEFNGNYTRAYTAEQDPPPAYSASIERRDIHELPAEPASPRYPRRNSPAPQQVTQPTQPTMTILTQEDNNPTETNATTPLLGRAPDRSSRRCGSFFNDKTGRRRYRFRRILLLAMVVVVIVLIMGCQFYDEDNSGDTLIGKPTPSSSAPSTPMPSDATPNREFRQHEAFGSITGTIPLYDLIDISTITGSIDVEIDPQPGDSAAVLRVSSEFGNIRLSLSSNFLQNHKTHTALERRFETSVNNSIGSISGTVLMGNGGMLDVSALTAGSIQISILMTGASPFDATTNIATMTNVGLHSVKVQSLNDAYPVTSIRATHIAAGTSSLELEYPPEWIGKISATAAGTGFVKVSGDKLTFMKSETHEVVAYKGSSSKANLIEARVGGIGSIHFTC